MPAAAPFAELPDAVDLPAVEREVLARWHEHRIPGRSVEQTAGGPAWIFYAGPPTASGMPGVHHIEARVLKDALPRFKTMQGFHVPRRAGWDCHGLPVEVAVEKELGLGARAEIESYGIAAFNARCRESVLRHVDAFAGLTARMGCWTGPAAAYQTMDPAYIESVWWSLKELFGRGLLARDTRVSPYCPRCETPLSEHELDQPHVYRAVTSPSVTVRFPLRELPAGAPAELAGADLLVHTTRPWTLVASTAVAVHPDLTYAVARRSGHGDRVVVADDLFARILGDGWHITRRLAGSELAGARYEPPLRLIEVPGAHRVITAAFVTAGEGTGLTHLAPAFGSADLAAARASELPVVNPVRPDGTFAPDIPLVGGLFFQAADHRLVTDLGDRGLLLRSVRVEHDRPHCWRCGTPLLAYAAPGWFIGGTAATAATAGDQLAAGNVPPSRPPAARRDGEDREWPRAGADWVLSRARYWGTPLPVWTCPAGHDTCVGSLAELSRRAGRDLEGLDPHRPYVDDVVIGCPDCGAPARRVPEVIDAGYDSGSMPFAQFGAPSRNERAFAASYPAQLACVSSDQAPGWLHSLMTVGTLAFGRPAYQDAVGPGLVTDGRGRPMSRHLGNVLEPMALLDARGADAVRWLFAVSGSPGSARTIADGALEDIERTVLLSLWDTASLLVGSARGAAARGEAWMPADRAGGTAPPPVPERPPVDRWLISELQRLVRDTTSALEAFDAATAGRLLAGFLADLSHFYARRSRQRLQAGPVTPGGASAFATLYDALETLTRLMAPIAPFLTDYLWGVLHGGSPPDSVHLAAWPVPDEDLIDDQLGVQMGLARRLVGLGQAARASAALPPLQPLARALVAAPGFASLPGGLRADVCDELGVRALEPLGPATEDLVRHAVRASLPALGERFGPGAPAVAAAIGTADPAVLAAAMRAAGTATVIVDSAPVILAPGDVSITEIPRPGWSVASEGDETVALDVAISPGLHREGLAREVARLVEEARRADGLEAGDRIGLRWATADPELAAALAEHGELIAAETRADECGPADAAAGGPGGREHAAAGLALTFWLRGSQAQPGPGEDGPGAGRASRR